jgi:hypothetical protein
VLLLLLLLLMLLAFLRCLQLSAALLPAQMAALPSAHRTRC